MTKKQTINLVRGDDSEQKRVSNDYILFGKKEHAALIDRFSAILSDVPPTNEVKARASHLVEELFNIFVAPRVLPSSDIGVYYDDETTPSGNALATIRRIDASIGEDITETLSQNGLAHKLLLAVKRFYDSIYCDLHSCSYGTPEGDRALEQFFEGSVMKKDDLSDKDLLEKICTKQELRKSAAQKSKRPSSPTFCISLLATAMTDQLFEKRNAFCLKNKGDEKSDMRPKVIDLFESSLFVLEEVNRQLGGFNAVTEKMKIVERNRMNDRDTKAAKEFRKFVEEKNPDSGKKAKAEKDEENIRRLARRALTPLSHRGGDIDSYGADLYNTPTNTDVINLPSFAFGEGRKPLRSAHSNEIEDLLNGLEVPIDETPGIYPEDLSSSERVVETNRSEELY